MTVLMSGNVATVYDSQDVDCKAALRKSPDYRATDQSSSGIRTRGRTRHGHKCNTSAYVSYLRDRVELFANGISSPSFGEISEALPGRLVQVTPRQRPVPRQLLKITGAVAS